MVMTDGGRPQEGPEKYPEGNFRTDKKIEMAVLFRR